MVVARSDFAAARLTAKENTNPALRSRRLVAARNDTVFERRRQEFLAFHRFSFALLAPVTVLVTFAAVSLQNTVSVPLPNIVARNDGVNSHDHNS